MMQVIGLVGWGAIGFVLGVLVTVAFGKLITAAAVAEAKAVAFDAARMMSDAHAKSRAVLNGIEMRIHNKIDTLKADVSADVKKL